MKCPHFALQNDCKPQHCQFFVDPNFEGFSLGIQLPGQAPTSQISFLKSLDLQFFLIAQKLQILSQQMENFQKIQAQVQSTDEIIGQNRDILQGDRKFKKIAKKVIGVWQSIKKLAQQHKSKIYLVITVLAIIQGFISDSYYRSNLTCGREKEGYICYQEVMQPAGDKVASFLLFIFTDCFVLIFFIYSLIFKKTYRILPALGIIQQYLLFYSGEFQMSIHDMTGMVKAGHYPLFAIFSFFFVVTALFRKYVKKNMKYNIAGLLIIIIVIVYFSVWRNQCYQWKKGINGEIQASQGSCTFKAPLCLYMKATSHFDLNFFFHNCFLGDRYKKYFDKYFSLDIQNGTIVGFDSFKEGTERQMTHDTLSPSVFKKAKRYKTIQEAKATNKHDVIFDTVEQRYHIDVVYNSTLAQEKAEIRSKAEASPSPPLAKNVLLIFLDSVSRFQTRLKLPKMVAWFQKQAKHKSYSPVEPIQAPLSQSKAEAYEFYKYHALGYSTYYNLYPMFYGYHLSQMRDMQNKSKGNFTKFPSLHQSYSDRGFITSFSETICVSYGADIFQTDLGPFVNPKADHQSFSFNCDPNFFEPFTQYGYAKGISASTDRCLYHKTEAEYAFQYTVDFFEKYKNSSKLSQINLIEGHDYFGGSVRFIDNAITLFLEQLQKKGHLKDTLVVAVSDHGQHFGSISESITSDHYNPFLYLAVPQEINMQYREGIRLNQQNLISAFNIYHFLMHIAVGQAYPSKDIGLMGDLSFQTSCINANITQPNEKCFCYDS